VRLYALSALHTDFLLGWYYIMYLFTAPEGRIKKRKKVHKIYTRVFMARLINMLAWFVIVESMALAWILYVLVVVR